MIKIFFPYIYLTQCWFIVLWKMLGFFFLYFPVHPRFTISELIESDNKTNGKTSQKPLLSHCIFYNKYRKLGLYWRFYHVPTSIQITFRYIHNWIKTFHLSVYSLKWEFFKQFWQKMHCFYNIFSLQVFVYFKC